MAVPATMQEQRWVRLFFGDPQRDHMNRRLNHDGDGDWGFSIILTIVILRLIVSKSLLWL